MINLPIGQLFINIGLITDKQLERALEEQKICKNERLGDIILKLGYVTERQYLKALSIRMNVKVIDELVTRIEPFLMRIFPYEQAKKYKVLPLGLENNVLSILTHDPLDFYALDDIRLLTGLEVKTVLALKSTIDESIEMCYTQANKKKIIKTDVMSVTRDIIEFMQEREYKDIAITNDGKKIYVAIDLI